MLAQTISLCRRLLGKAPTEATVAQDDRRLWVRYQADLQAQIQLAQDDGTERLAAEVRDVSVGGANLIVDRAFRPGQMISLELPVAGGDLQIILACIVRVTPLGPNQWSLGCAFARELTPQDLEKFSAHAATPQNQRTWVRHPCTLQATYQRVGEMDLRSYAAQVLNVSASGVGLMLRDPLDPGSLINLELRGPHGKPLRTILACVVHCTERANQDRVVGCNFIRELAEHELQAMLNADA